MKFKNDYRPGLVELSQAGMIESAVDQNSYDTHGAVETVQAEVRELTKIVGRLLEAGKFTDKQALEISGLYGYTVVKK